MQDNLAICESFLRASARYVHQLRDCFEHHSNDVDVRYVFTCSIPNSRVDYFQHLGCREVDSYLLVLETSELWAAIEYSSNQDDEVGSDYVLWAGILGYGQ